MAYFHFRCGERITLINENTTAIRNDNEFDHGLVITSEPLLHDTLFEVIIDRKVNTWSGSLEMGVVDVDPFHFDFPPCLSRVQSGSWIMSGSSIFKNGVCLVERYGSDLDKLNQFDRIGLLITAEGDLIFFINGESQGVAAENLPSILYGIVNLYGKCVQVSITSPLFREHNNDECLSGSSVLAIDNDILNVTLGGDLSELSLSSSNSLDIRMDVNVGVNLSEENSRQDKLRFHERCGSLVKLSNGSRTAERRRPYDEFNNGVVMTSRPLKDNELFEIRIDRLVDKWSGSIEMGVTTHNPSALVFPATMTNMRSGTIMMSGCGILTNGKGTKREYGDFNLDELTEGDRVGMMRKSDGNLHYFINGLDQGVATRLIPAISPSIWGVIDLYGMTIKVSIVERDEREEQNLMTRKISRNQQPTAQVPEPNQPLSEYYDRLTFHPNCGTHAEVLNNGRTAHRPNSAVDYNNGVVLTARPLRIGEFFEVRLDKVVMKWAGSIEIGVTTHSPVNLEFPFTMTNVKSGTWMMTGGGIMHNGNIINELYGVNLDRLQVGDRVGLVRKDNGELHFFVNGADQGCAVNNIPEKVYGVVDLYGQAVAITIIDMYDNISTDTINSTLSNVTIYSDLRFHHVHGKNAKIINNGLTAMRPRPLAEFNEAIVFSNRPLKDGEMFEIVLDSIVDRWSGSIELGVTAVRPDDVELPSTATDLTFDTWMLSGSSIMINGKTSTTNYPCDLDTLSAGVRLGVMRTADKSLQFYKDGVFQGTACVVPHNNIYAVVDLYGQCARVSISCSTPVPQQVTVAAASVAAVAAAAPVTCPCLQPDTIATLPVGTVANFNPVEVDVHRFSEIHDKGITLTESGRIAARSKECNSGIIFSNTQLAKDDIFEVVVEEMWPHMAGTLCFGVCEMSPNFVSNTVPNDCYYLNDNELRHGNQVLEFFDPNLNWLSVGNKIGLLLMQDSAVKIYINGEELPLQLPPFKTSIWAFFQLKGQCAALSVTSHTIPLPSPINSVRLQDSLELALEVKQMSSSLHNSSNTVNDISTNQFEFYENHGRNIELYSNKTVAKRVASYNHGVVLVVPPLESNKAVQVVIEGLESKWQSSVIVGVVVGQLEKLNIPVSALALKGHCYIIANDWILINGVKGRSNCGQALNSLATGDTISIAVSENKYLKLTVNGNEQVLPWSYPNGESVYAVFDLYGQCQQLRLSNEETVTKRTVPAPLNTPGGCEKADLESAEKERVNENNLSLSLPCTSLAHSDSNFANISVTKSEINSPLAFCMFKEECENFKKNLLLPDHYFLSEEPVCYCMNCYMGKTEGVDKDSKESKEEVPLGWVKFSVRNLTKINTDKWHMAFYPTKIGAVRCILDKKQPLTNGQSQWCNFIAPKNDDGQIIFYPSIKLSDAEPYAVNNRQAYACFQIYVKPNAYSVTRESESVEWNTKESGAIVLHSLLLQLK